MCQTKSAVVTSKDNQCGGIAKLEKQRRSLVRTQGCVHALENETEVESIEHTNEDVQSISTPALSEPT